MLTRNKQFIATVARMRNAALSTEASAAAATPATTDATAAVVDIPAPDTALPRVNFTKSWETYYMQERRQYKQHVHLLRKRYLEEHWNRMSAFYARRLQEWESIQKQKLQRQEQRKLKSVEIKAQAAEREALVKSAYSALAAQKRTQWKREQAVKDMKRMLLLADMNQTSHTWIDASNIDGMIKPELFDFRVPIQGLPAHRSEREEAMIAYFSTKDRMSLPESVYEALGLATDAALRRVLKSRADTKEEFVVDENAPAEPEVSATQSSDDAASAVDAPAAGEPTEAEVAAVSVASATEPLKKDSKDRKFAREMRAANEVGDDIDESALSIKIDQSGDSYLLAAPMNHKPTLRQRFASLLSGNLTASTLTSFKEADKLYGEERVSVARQVINDVGLTVLEDEEARFDVWFEYTEYLFAMPHERAHKYAVFLTNLLKRQGLDFEITVEDVESIQQAQAEIRSQIDAAVRDLEVQQQARRKNKNKSNKGTSLSTEARARDFMSLRDELLSSASKHRDELFSAASQVAAKAGTALEFTSSTDKFTDQIPALVQQIEAQTALQKRLFESCPNFAAEDIQQASAAILTELLSVMETEQRLIGSGKRPDAALLTRYATAKRQVEEALASKNSSSSSDSSSSSSSFDPLLSTPLQKRVQALEQDASNRQLIASAVADESLMASLVKGFRSAIAERAAADGTAQPSLTPAQAQEIKAQVMQSLLARQRNKVLQVKLQAQRSLDFGDDVESLKAFESLESFQRRLQQERRDYEQKLQRKYGSSDDVLKLQLKRLVSEAKADAALDEVVVEEVEVSDEQISRARAKREAMYKDVATTAAADIAERAAAKAQVKQSVAFSSLVESTQAENELKSSIQNKRE